MVVEDLLDPENRSIMFNSNSRFTGTSICETDFNSLLSVQNFARNVEVNAAGKAKIAEAQKAEAVLPEAEFQVNMEEKLRL